MSTTPLTDAIVFNAYEDISSGWGGEDRYHHVGPAVDADFARELERQRDACSAALDDAERALLVCVSPHPFGSEEYAKQMGYRDAALHALNMAQMLVHPERYPKP